ncbi:hypothetical protein ACV3R5_16205 [Clostridium perfringens]|nr:hypothetical protein [Clostridium perfringens]MDU6697836.1 hypothetical protein [Clostridium perfringens]HAT4114545.1 hypothetical protein [Clostridium perfringens]
MKKVIKSKIILGIIIIIAISIVGIKMATKEEMNIKGVKFEKGKIVETDLGKYNKNKKYEGYEAYILSDNSEYNIFKNDKVEVKYPKKFEVLYVTGKETDFSIYDRKVFMRIFSQHVDKDITTKEIIEKRKKIMEENKKALNYSNIEFNSEENKIFEIDTGENNKYGGFSETIINGKDICEVSIFHNGIEVKNWDEIIKNIKESFKVL